MAASRLAARAQQKLSAGRRRMRPSCVQARRSLKSADMTRLSIRHETTYLYDRPVRFGPWRLMMRPQDSHALRLIDAQLSFTPGGETRWIYDVFGNSVCELHPQGESARLTVVNQLLLDRFPSPAPPPAPGDALATLPVLYDPWDRVVLEPFVRPATEDKDDAYLAWLRRFSGDVAFDVLQQVNTTIHEAFRYEARDEPGVQSPEETVERGVGTCRDFAWLMIESVRRLGFGARFVTGYIYTPGSGVSGAGATHAWCEVFVPRLGWVEFDPTNGLVESHDLIRIASTRTPQEAVPMGGVILGEAKAEMQVRVDVERIAPAG